MLHGKPYLAASQFQNGTGVRQAATELQARPDLLSDRCILLYDTTLLSVPKESWFYQESTLFSSLFFPNVKTGSLEYRISQTIKYVWEQMRAIQKNDSYSLVRLCVSSTPINKTELFSKLWIVSDSETRRCWAGFVVTLKQSRWIIWYIIKVTSKYV